MLWFLLFGAIGYAIYKIYRRRWFRSLQREVSEFKGQKYSHLSKENKLKVRKLVDAIFSTGTTLDDETSTIVTEMYQGIQQEDFWTQDVYGISESQNANSSK